MWTVYKSIRRLLSVLFWWFLYTRFGQWLSTKVSGGWCYLDRFDSRFTVALLESRKLYAGSPSASPDRGISNQRNAWKTWIFAKAEDDSYPTKKAISADWYLAIDTHNDRRMACLGQKIRGDEVVRFRVGHEDGIAHAIITGKGLSKLVLLARWTDDGSEPPEEIKCLLANSRPL